MRGEDLYVEDGGGRNGIFVNDDRVLLDQKLMDGDKLLRMKDSSPGGTNIPFLFITIACGAISGFHSVVSSGTTCKQLDSEAHACRIGYGAMIMESTVAALVVIAVGAGLSATRHAELLRAPGGAIAAPPCQGSSLVTDRCDDRLLI